MQAPTLKDVHAARPRVYAALQPTPLMRHPLLAAELGLDVYVKHENHNPTGAFKVRGGLVYLDGLRQAEPKTPGVISATRGRGRKW